ncbi:unnamed protein product [Rotaria sp. Silwood2]|nr:unnamed protein product [Rotaria sp. Silwood2]
MLRFYSWDVSHDGQIDRSELSHLISAIYDRAGVKDRQGEKNPQSRAKAIINKLDVSGDKKLNREEFINGFINNQILVIMIALTTTGTIYVALSNIYDVQQNSIFIQPSVYCKFIRYSRYNPTSTQPAVTRDFDVVVNAEGLNNGITLTLSALPVVEARYGLTITATDAQGYSFVDNKPIMLTQKGQVNENLPPVRKTLYPILDSNMQAPAAQVRNNALYHFPNFGTN